MAHCLVTGAAGFIGSHLCEVLLARGHRVTGIDAFIPYYPRVLKEVNLTTLHLAEDWTFYELDLRTAPLDQLLENVDVVIHLAAMAGLVRSWSDFDLYVSCNLNATQRLLEATRAHQVRHFILGSTSSVYGLVATGNEDSPLAPSSPYGVTKLAAEHLCRAYAANFNLPVTILRFFSVYGPRQRPDMAYHRFICALLSDDVITVYGDGEQSRSNTYVTDCVAGILGAMEARDLSVGETFNLGGGEVRTLNEVIGMLAELTGKTPQLRHAPVNVGDQRSTGADIGKARRLLGFAPSTSLRDGLATQLTWQQSQA